MCKTGMQLMGFPVREVDTIDGRRVQDDPPIVLGEYVVVHGCCGCSCHVCAAGHSAGLHTQACHDRLMAECGEGI
jgi:hypothetical protein